LAPPLPIRAAGAAVPLVARCLVAVERSTVDDEKFPQWRLYSRFSPFETLSRDIDDLHRSK